MIMTKGNITNNVEIQLNEGSMNDITLKRIKKKHARSARYKYKNRKMKCFGF